MDITHTYRAPVVAQGPTLIERAGSQLVQWLSTGWHDSSLQADERYLAGAADMHELERRLQAVERGDPTGVNRLWL